MISVLDEFNVCLTKAWKGRKHTTAVWEEDKTGVYAGLAEKLQLKYWPEYWDIDAAFYRKLCLVSLREGKYYGAKALSLVIEHENDSTSSCHEINKLTTLNTPLKVLVTYPRQTDVVGLPADELLGKYAQQVAAVDAAIGHCSDKQKYVVVFGVLEDKKIVWEYHLYENGKFNPLELASNSPVSALRQESTLSPRRLSGGRV